MMSLVSFGVVVGWITVGVLAAAILFFCVYIICKGFQDRRELQQAPTDELPPLRSRLQPNVPPHLDPHRAWSDVKDTRRDTPPPSDPAS